MVRNRWKTRSLAVAVGLLAALVATEAALQAVALVLWMNGGPDSRGSAEGPVVLAVGDSFTYGLGATTPAASYPAALADLLDAADRPCRVVNAGVPGNSTVDVAARIAGLVDRHRPRVVALLVGYNDLAKSTRPLADGEIGSGRAADGFPLRWRSGELFDRIRGAVGGGGFGAVDADALLGTWSDGEVTISFAADGTCEVGGVGVPFDLADDRLSIGPAGGRVAYRARIVDETLVLTPADPGRAGLELRRSAVVGDAAEPLRQRFIDRLSGLEPLDPAAVRAACDALDAAEVPVESELWWRLIATATAGVETARVVATIESALARLPADAPWRAGLLRALGILAMGGDPQRGLVRFVEAFAVDGRFDGIAAQLTARFPGEELAALDAALDAAEVAPGAAVRLRQALAPRFASDESLVATIAGNLARLAAHCDEAGARVVLLTYPEVHPVVHNAVRAAAARSGARLVDVAAGFAAELARDPDRQLFVPDRHCNDAGYRLLAEIVAPQIRAALAESR